MDNKTGEGDEDEIICSKVAQFTAYPSHNNRCRNQLVLIYYSTFSYNLDYL